MMGDGNDTFETAEMLPLDTQLDGDLPAKDVDYYKLSGKKGQALFFIVQAQGQALAFDPDAIDTVITLYDASHKQVAFNNDRVPRGSNDSELMTILPADGDYYLRVAECWTAIASPKSYCQGTADKTQTSYSLFVVPIDPTVPGNVLDAEKGNDAASATPISYAPAQGGGYYLTIVGGTYASQSDVDVFKFHIPADAVKVPAGHRSGATTYLLPAGTNGNGSTTSAGKIYIVDPANPMKRVAEITGTDYLGTAGALGSPLQHDKDYLLFVEHPGNALGSNDFYLLLHGPGYSNPLETNEAANDDPKTPDPTTASMASYYVEGDLINGGMDLDHYAMTSAPGTTKVSIACTAQRAGSALRGFTGELFYNDAMSGMPKSVASVVETATKDAYSGVFNLPSGVTSYVFKASSAQSADPNITSAFYRCGIHFQQ
jgi:hypothetical protein